MATPSVRDRAAASTPGEPGWYECRCLRNLEVRVARWWSGSTLYHTQNGQQVGDIREYTDFIGPLVPASRDEGLREALKTSLRQWKGYYSDNNSDDIENGKHAEAELYLWCRAALSPPLSIPDERGAGERLEKRCRDLIWAWRRISNGKENPPDWRAACVTCEAQLQMVLDECAAEPVGEEVERLAEWDEWYRGMLADFRGVTDEPNNPDRFHGWDWIEQHRPPPAFTPKRLHQ